MMQDRGIQIEQDQIEYVYYDLKGQVSSKVDDVSSPLKVIKYPESGKTKYMAKVGSRSLFNPLKDTIDQRDKVRRSSDSYVFKFREINEKTFELYREFLETKNMYLLKQANMTRT
jgi:hypothetical protein